MDYKKLESKVQIDSSIWPLDLFHIQKRIKNEDKIESNIIENSKKVLNDGFQKNSLPKYHYDGLYKSLPSEPLSQIVLIENFINNESISK